MARLGGQRTYINSRLLLALFLLFGAVAGHYIDARSNQSGLLSATWIFLAVGSGGR